jgi:hypothetical protein
MMLLRAIRFNQAVLAIPLVFSLGRSGVAAPPTAPPPPKQYTAHIRYQIDAGRSDRLAQYYAMTRYFRSLGFVVDPEQEELPQDPNETRMSGVIPSENARKLFADSHVKSLLLIPTDYKVPEDGTAPVKVQLEIAGGLPLDRQRVFVDQVRAKLAQLGFQETIGYDHRGQTRLVGWIPAWELETLLKDLRWEPSGWLAPREPVTELASPLRKVSPIRVTEVIPEPKDVTPAKSVEVKAREDEQGNLQKISAELREIAEREDQAKRQRMEVILNYTPRAEDRQWRRDLKLGGVDAAWIEGRLGQIVTIAAPVKLALSIAELPTVSGVRLPRPAWYPVRTAPQAGMDSQEALRSSGLERYHGRGSRGQGVRMAVIDIDFRGYQTLQDKKKYTGGVRYVDLTAERNYSLEPDPFSSDAEAVGSGTQCALAALLATPEAELTLIRIDPAAPHQLEAAARWINGESFFSDSMTRRNIELEADADHNRRRMNELLEERKLLLNLFAQDEDTTKKRLDHFKKRAEWDKDQQEFRKRQGRFLDLMQAQQALKGIQVVSSSLVWNSGYPLGGNNALTSYLEEHGKRGSFWFQAAGDTRGQTWAGLFLDTDGNGVMEFAPPTAPLRLERWTPELNFLGWQPAGKQRVADLPEKVRIRVSIQWREVHDADVYQYGDDAYRRPLADLGVVVLRQRDPTGTKLATDDLEVVSRSRGMAQRLDNQPTTATYEQLVEFTTDITGRYAVRIEGRKPVGTLPTGTPGLPGNQQSWELWPRIFVEVVDGPSRLKGRAVFWDYATDAGALGMPAEARSVITVGAADAMGRPEPDSTIGPPLNRALLWKPDILAYGNLGTKPPGTAALRGSSLATPFAAGITGTALSARVHPGNWERYLRMQPGKLLRLP